jgi:endonuclease/exonuclease/phosphatase family metal-dependent hydrolase
VVATARIHLERKAVTVASAHAAPEPRGHPGHLEAILGLPETPLVIGADLNARPEEVDATIRRFGLDDACAGGGASTWPTSAAEFADVWERQTGEPPDFTLEPRRIDYLLSRGLTSVRSDVVAVGTSTGFVSDHVLLWADYTHDAVDGSP